MYGKGAKKSVLYIRSWQDSDQWQPDDFPEVWRLIFGKAVETVGSESISNEEDKPSGRSHVVREELFRGRQHRRLEVDVKDGGQEHQVED